MGKYFGTDGFRGEANVGLNVEHAYKVGRFLGAYYKEQHPDTRAKIVIGGRWCFYCLFWNCSSDKSFFTSFYRFYRLSARARIERQSP